MAARSRFWLVVAAAAIVSGCLLAAQSDLAPADLYLTTADQLARDWNYRDALQMYGRAEQIADGPRRLRAGVGVATSAIRLAEFELAYAKASQLKAQFPDAPEALGTYGQAAWSAAMFEEAAAAFRDVLASHPSDARSLLGMARVLSARHQVGAALQHALAAAAAAPREPEPAAVVAGIYKSSRRFDQAIAWYEKYLSMLPARETEKRGWTDGEIRFLKSFGRRVPIQAADDAISTVHRIPFRLVNDKVVVAARVNGTEGIDFVVDTGAEQTVLSERTARRLGVNAVSATVSAGVGEIGLRGLQYAMLESLQIGSLTLRNVPCLIKTPPLPDLPMRESEALSPLSLGLSTVIDYRGKELIVASNLAVEPPGVHLPLWFSRLAIVRGLVNDERPASFIVDTGGEVISISRETVRMLTPQWAGRRVPIQVYGTSGWDRDAYLLPGVTIAFDRVALRNFSVAVLNLRAPSVLLGYQVGGTIGHRLLSRYRVTIDLQRSILALE